jgi:pyrimidine-specific ribonucleoside hydrolase
LKSIEPNDLTDSASVRVVLDLDVAAVEQLWFKTIDKGWL